MLQLHEFLTLSSGLHIVCLLMLFYTCCSEKRKKKGKQERLQRKEQLLWCTLFSEGKLLTSFKPVVTIYHGPHPVQIIIIIDCHDDFSPCLLFK